MGRFKFLVLLFALSVAGPLIPSVMNRPGFVGGHLV